MCSWCVYELLTFVGKPTFTRDLKERSISFARYRLKCQKDFFVAIALEPSFARDPSFTGAGCDTSGCVRFTAAAAGFAVAFTAGVAGDRSRRWDLRTSPLLPPPSQRLRIVVD